MGHEPDPNASTSPVLGPLSVRPPRNDPVTPGPSPPLWVRVADVATIVLGVLVVHVAIFGSLRLGTLLSIGDPWRALVLLTVITGLRHYFVRTPPLHRRVWTSLRAGWRYRSVSGRLADRSRDAAGGTARRLSRRGLARLPGGSAADPRVRQRSSEPGVALGHGVVSQHRDGGLSMVGRDRGSAEHRVFSWLPTGDQRRGDRCWVPRRCFDQPLDRPPRQAMVRLQQRFLGSALLVSLLAFAWGMVWLYRLAREHLDPNERHTGHPAPARRHTPSQSSSAPPTLNR